MHIWLLRWDRPVCCGHANQSVCISLPRLGDITQGWDEWLRFPQRCNGVTVWQHQQSDWPLSFADVAVLRTRRCLFYRMMVSWPMAHSQTAQGQLSIYRRASLASLPSSYGIRGCSTGETGGEVGSIPTRGILQVCSAQSRHSPRR